MKTVNVIMLALCITLATSGQVHAQGKYLLAELPMQSPNCPDNRVAMPFDIRLNLKQIEEIPFFTPTLKEVRGNDDWGCHIAFQIALGSRIWALIRERQDEFNWYFGRIDPHGSRESYFTWDRDQRLCYLLEDGSSVYSEMLVVSSASDAPLYGEPLILSNGMTLSFDDILINTPQGQKILIWAGFPKGSGQRRWDMSDVVKLQVVIGGTSEGEVTR